MACTPRRCKEGKSLQDGSIPHVVRGGLKDGFVKVSDYGPSVSDKAKEAAEASQSEVHGRNNGDL